MLDSPRQNRFLPKGIYTWQIKQDKYYYEKYRACLKINNQTITIGYYDSLYEACEAFSIAHEEWYGTKPHWYKDFKKFYKTKPNYLEF